ncbi:MAG: hypothetical protein ABI885_16555 [Gammaproteobacteria bacterium]
MLNLRLPAAHLPAARSVGIALAAGLCIVMAACSKNGDPKSPAAATAPVSAPKACDRACLEGFIEQYLDALAAHDPSRLRVASSVKFVENNQPLKLGEGTWKTVTGLGKYRHYFADPESGQVAVITLVQENGADALFDVRLSVADRKITEAEAMIIRDTRGAANYAKIDKPESLWLDTVPAAERATREQLIATTNKYFSSMAMNDGKGDYSFFADDCNRLEHGLKTTNNAPSNYGHSSDKEFVTLGCADQFRTGFLGFVTRIRDRRYLVVDVERQAVFAFNFLDHNGTIREIPLSSGKKFKIPQFFSIPRTLQVGEAFRIHDNRIQRIEMTLNEYPYGMKPAWPTKDPAPTAAPIAAKTTLPATCDRKCLESAVDQVLAAFTSHNPANAPLAPNVKYTENDQRLAIGDGLWGTATKVGSYRVTFADPEHNEVAFLGQLAELDVPGVLALRLKVANGLITEIEAVLPREEISHADTLFRPRLLTELQPKLFTKVDPAFARELPAAERTPRDKMLEIANQYFDAVDQRKSAAAPFAPDCSRRENGAQTTRDAQAPALDPNAKDFHPFSLGCEELIDSGYFSYVADIRDRREWVVDEERGVVVLVGYKDIPGTTKSFAARNSTSTVSYPTSQGIPYTLLSPTAIKIENGKIRRIEVLDKTVPYGMKPEWKS